MAALTFAALVHKEGERYRARVLEVPEVEAEATDLGSLREGVRDALEQALYRHAAAGKPLAAAAANDSVAHAAEQSGDWVMLIDVSVDDRPVRVNISIGERLLRRLDAAASDLDTTRSGLIALAVRRYLERASKERGAGDLREEIETLGRRLTDRLGPDSAFGRTLSDLDARAIEGLGALTTVLRSSARRRARTPDEPQSGSPGPAPQDLSSEADTGSHTEQRSTKP